MAFIYTYVPLRNQNRKNEFEWCSRDLFYPIKEREQHACESSGNVECYMSNVPEPVFKVTENFYFYHFLSFRKFPVQILVA